MKSGRPKIFILICIAALFATRSFAAETNSISSSTNADALVNGYLQVQAQLHATQLQIEQSRAEAAAEAKRNADAMAARIQALEQTVAEQRAAATDAARLTWSLAGLFGLAGLGVLLLTGWFQWRAFSQLAEISSHHGATLAAVQGVHQLAAPGRATVEVTNGRLLDIVGQLEKKILELESGGRLLGGRMRNPPTRSPRDNNGSTRAKRRRRWNVSRKSSLRSRKTPRLWLKRRRRWTNLAARTRL